MRNISAWAIKNPLLPLILFAVLTVYGLVSFKKLPITLNPDVTSPFVHVLVSQPGAAPSEIEKQILQKVDAVLATINGVKNVTSAAYEGTATLWAEFQVGVPEDRALNDVRDAVARVRADLPQGIQEPYVERVDFAGAPLAFYAVNTTGMTEEQLSWFVDDTIAKRLMGLRGVAQVQRVGGVNREIRVDLDLVRMQSAGITAAELNQQIRQLNLDATGGRAQVGGSEQSIRVLGGARSAAQLGDMQLMISGGRVVRLRDVAEVRDGVAELRGLARLNGRKATLFSVSHSKHASEIDAYQRVEAELDKIRSETTSLSISRVFTSVDFTRQMYRSSLESLILGALLAVAIVYLFLRDWRATMISALAIPLSAIPTFTFLQMLGFTLNQLSLLALTLVTGVLVDDAIVEIENITRHMKMGKSGYRAAMEAADEIGLAVVATSMTIIAVFLPVAFMTGTVGQYFKQFGLTVAVSVFMSLLVARLITPVLAAYLLRPNAALRSADGRFMDWYLRCVRWSVAHRWKTVIVGLVLFIVSLLGLWLVPKSVFTDEDYAYSTLNIELPPGVQLAQTATVAERASAILRRRSDVESVVEFVGSDDEVRNAQLYITLAPRGVRKLTRMDWEQTVVKELRTIPDAHIGFQSDNGGGDRAVTKFVVGSDPELVEQTARSMIAQMRGLKELLDPRINGDYRRPELLIKPRAEMAAQLGITPAAISETVRIATLGDIPQNSARYSLSDRQIPIRVSLVESARRDLGTIENMPIRTAGGGTVPLKAVADIGFGQGPARIRHYNQQRRLTIDADLNHVAYGVAQAKIEALPAFKHLPTGVRVVEQGQGEFQDELFGGFLTAVGAGMLVVLAVLVILFGRLFQPITILSALPLSVGGAVLALGLTGNSFSISTVIGLLMLMGIVGKNSILLVDFAIEQMRAGVDRQTALVEAGHKRARPIVMTTVAMVAGMLPSALQFGTFMSPMAVTVIGGLIASTALTLVMVPALFTMLDDIERWVSRRLRPASGSVSAVTPTLAPSADS